MLTSPCCMYHDRRTEWMMPRPNGRPRKLGLPRDGLDSVADVLAEYCVQRTGTESAVPAQPVLSNCDIRGHSGASNNIYHCSTEQSKRAKSAVWLRKPPDFWA